MAQLASTATGLEVIAWTSVFGLPSARSSTAPGSVCKRSQSTRSRRRGRQLRTRPGEDSIAKLVGFAGSGERTGNFASAIVAECPRGRIARPAAWGVDILSHVSELTGLDGWFLRALYGPWATLVTISAAENMEEVDDATASLAAGASCVDRIDDAGPLFVPGSASHRLLRRLAEITKQPHNQQGAMSCRSTCSKRSTRPRACGG